MNRDDYTSLALEIYDKIVYHGWKFRKDRNLNSWLSYSWGLLFKRELTESQIEMLKAVCKERQRLEIKLKAHGYKKLSHKDRTNLKNTWIGSDGYVYMRKIIPFDEELSQRLADRDAHLFDDLHRRKEAELEQEKKELHWDARRRQIANRYCIRNGKIYER